MTKDLLDKLRADAARNQDMLNMLKPFFRMAPAEMRASMAHDCREFEKMLKQEAAFYSLYALELEEE